MQSFSITASDRLTTSTSQAIARKCKIMPSTQPRGDTSDNVQESLSEDTASQISHLTSLPAELQVEIFHHLPSRKDRANFSLTSKILYRNGATTRSEAVILRYDRLAELGQLSGTGVSLRPRNLPSVVTSLIIQLWDPPESDDAQQVVDDFDSAMNSASKPEEWDDIKAVVLTTNTCASIANHQSDQGMTPHPVTRFLSALPSVEVLGFDGLDEGLDVAKNMNVLFQLPFLQEMRALKRIDVLFRGESDGNFTLPRGPKPNDPSCAPDSLPMTVHLDPGPDSHHDISRELMRHLAETLRLNSSKRSIEPVTVTGATAFLEFILRRKDSHKRLCRTLNALKSDPGLGDRNAIQAFFEDPPEGYKDLKLTEEQSKRIRWVASTDAEHL